MSIDPTVTDFFSKGGTEYETLYRLDHGPRIRALLDRYGLIKALKGKTIVDVGGGQGFLGEMLEESTDYWVVDGANVPRDKRLRKGRWTQTDLDYDRFAETGWCEINEGSSWGGAWPQFDAAFCLETLEHLKSPYHTIEQLKMLVKPNAPIYLSVPTETVWHNTPNPSLFWPPANFAQWLDQMALPVTDFYVYQPKERGWPAYQYRCRNADWTEALMKYPKTEDKFRGKKPHEYSNL